MSRQLILLLAVIAMFGALTVVALLGVGYLGIFKPHFESWGAAQVLADLVILAILSCIWMVNDARKRGLAAWPFIIVTVLAGSFGPLSYLVLRELRSTAGQTSQSRSAAGAVR